MAQLKERADDHAALTQQLAEAIEVCREVQSMLADYSADFWGAGERKVIAKLNAVITQFTK